MLTVTIIHFVNACSNCPVQNIPRTNESLIKATIRSGRSAHGPINRPGLKSNTNSISAIALNPSVKSVQLQGIPPLYSQDSSPSRTELVDNVLSLEVLNVVEVRESNPPADVLLAADLTEICDPIPLELADLNEVCDPSVLRGCVGGTPMLLRDACDSLTAESLRDAVPLVRDTGLARLYESSPSSSTKTGLPVPLKAMTRSPPLENIAGSLSMTSNDGS